jgi:tRNA threonylcarbamoyladenosine biosynthesis protein TsaE
VSQDSRLITHSPSETRATGRALADLLQAGDIVLLAGQLGAGKTELAKGIAEGLGIKETVVSPTFTIVREYSGHPLQRIRMLHVDVYRLDHAQELLDLGLEDLAADEAVTVIEWGDAVAGFLPADHLLVEIELLAADQDRTLRFTVAGSTWTARAAAVAALLEA